KAPELRHFLPTGLILSPVAVVSFTFTAPRSLQNGSRQNRKPLANPPPFAVVSNTCLLSKAKDCGLPNGQPPRILRSRSLTTVHGHSSKWLWGVARRILPSPLFVRACKYNCV